MLLASPTQKRVERHLLYALACAWTYGFLAISVGGAAFPTAVMFAALVLMDLVCL